MFYDSRLIEATSVIPILCIIAIYVECVRAIPVLIKPSVNVYVQFIHMMVWYAILN